VLSQHPDVHQAVVILHQLAAEDMRLIAYLVPGLTQEPTSADLRHFMQRHLPAYMIPADFMILEAFPLLPNGKVNRQALPDPNLNETAVTQYVAPRSPTERTIARIWAAVLSKEKVGIHDNFFDLGGHSLLAVRLLAQLREAFQMEFPLRAFFETLTVADMALAVTEMMAAEGDESTMLALIDELKDLSAEELAALLDDEI
jgi:acyl carrier protein